MPRPRLHKDNAARQKAYRERQKAERAVALTRGQATLTQRVLAFDAQARAVDDAK